MEIKNRQQNIGFGVLRVKTTKRASSLINGLSTTHGLERQAAVETEGTQEVVLSGLNESAFARAVREQGKRAGLSRSIRIKEYPSDTPIHEVLGLNIKI